MLRGLDESLSRLGTDYVDLWQVHTWSDHVPLDETLQRSRLRRLVGPGPLRRRVQLRRLADGAGSDATKRRRPAGPDSRRHRSSTRCCSAASSARSRRRPRRSAWASSPGRRSAAACSSGKYRSGIPADSRGASPTFERYVGVHLNPRAAQIVEAVCKAAEGLELSPVEVALAWVRDQPGVAAPIVGARTAAQLAGLLTVEDVTLPDEIADALDDVSAPDVGYPEG